MVGCGLRAVKKAAKESPIHLPTSYFQNLGRTWANFTGRASTGRASIGVSSCSWTLSSKAKRWGQGQKVGTGSLLITQDAWSYSSYSYDEHQVYKFSHYHINYAVVTIIYVVNQLSNNYIMISVLVPNESPSSILLFLLGKFTHNGGAVRLQIHATSTYKGAIRVQMPAAQFQIPGKLMGAWQVRP
jgi:hypothetical protein